MAFLRNEVRQIDALVYNAVYYNLGLLQNKKIEATRYETEVGFIAPLHLTTAIINDVWQQPTSKDRSITFVTSGSGLGVIPNAGQATYSALKAALHMLTKHFSSELKEYNVRVNAVAPGRLTEPETLTGSLEELRKSIEDKDRNGVIVATDKDTVNYY